MGLLTSTGTIGGLVLVGGLGSLSWGIAISAIGELALVGTIALIGIGSFGVSIMFSNGADRFKSRVSRQNYVQNKEFRRICDEYGLDYAKRERIHRIISKKGYNAQKIIELIEELYPYLIRR